MTVYLYSNCRCHGALYQCTGAAGVDVDTNFAKWLTDDVTTRPLRVFAAGVFLESTTEFVVDATPVTATGEGKVKAFVTAPSGTRMETLVNNNNDGTYKCMYTPFEQGTYPPAHATPL